MKPKVVSLDMACTVFWEHGCDPSYPYKKILNELFLKINEFLRRKGYNVGLGNVDYSELYYGLWNEIWSRGPMRELWHRYVLLKYSYRLGAEIDYRTLDELYNLFIELRSSTFILPGKHCNVLQYLKGRGYKIVLTTGTGAHDLPLAILNKTGASRFFDLVFSTQLAGVPKNDKRFYEELVDTLGVEPYDIVHIGDSLRYDIFPAREAGLKTIYFGWRTKCRGTDPQPCIDDLTELVHLL